MIFNDRFLDNDSIEVKIAGAPIIYYERFLDNENIERFLDNDNIEKSSDNDNIEVKTAGAPRRDKPYLLSLVSTRCYCRHNLKFGILNSKQNENF